MEKFKVGDKVRERGTKQVMAICGDAGVATNSVTRGVVTSPGKVLCVWQNKSGRKIQRAFVENALELVTEDA
ncbi:hypothetical protein [Herbaspirillum huttiense]|uniref:hypothetical protein n=1 Tax=Herbaspirillum huttiense TaxID=863372 RepID=UPI0039AFF15D